MFKKLKKALSLSNKGQQAMLGPLQFFLGAVLLIAVIVIIMAFVAKVNGDIGAGFTSGSVEAGITENGSLVLTTAASNTNTIMLVVVAVVIIALLTGILAVFGGRRK